MITRRGLGDRLIPSAGCGCDRRQDHEPNTGRGCDRRKDHGLRPNIGRGCDRHKDHGLRDGDLSVV